MPIPTLQFPLAALLGNPYWLLFLLTLIYQSSVYLKQKTNIGLINPALITIAALIAYLLITKIDYQTFAGAAKIITFWLEPAVVCLAVPLYTQWQKIRAQWLAIVLSQSVGSAMGIVSGVLLVRLFGGSEVAALSVAGKSVTMPIAIEVAKNTGGALGITTATVLVAGVTGQVVGLSFLARTRQKSAMANGLAMGSASHALGIASITPLGARFVAYGTVGLILNGIFTAFLAPVLLPLLLG